MNKKQYCSQIQKDELVRLVTEDADLISGKLTNKFSFKDSQRRWENIASQLNAIPGGCKDWKQWRKTWQDIKSRTKTKKASLNRYVNGTGGGPPPPASEKLSSVEEKVVAILCPTSITGNKHIEESKVIFTFEDDFEIEGNNPEKNPEISDQYLGDGNFKETEFERDVSKWEEVSAIPNKNHESTPKHSTVEFKQKRTVASTRLQKSAEATATLADLSKGRYEFEKEMAIKKFELEKQYRERKLQLLERQAKAIEKLAESVQNK